MNNQRRLLIIVGGVVVFIGLIVAATLSLSPKQGSQAILLTYTDKTTGETRDTQPFTNTNTKYGEVIAPEPSLVSVTGIQSFYDSLGDPEMVTAINDQIVSFVHAHSGPSIDVNEVAIVNASVKKTGTNPDVYTFEMVLKHPEGRYSGTITMQNSELTPIVKITKEQE